METIGRALLRHRHGRILLWRNSQPVIHTARSFSTAKPATQPPNATTTADDELGPELLLYQRQSDTSVRMLQSGFFVTSFHTAYWVWYVTDFLPLVNASPMDQLHIHPAWGFAGLSLAVALNSIFVVFPKRFISKITYRPNLEELAVYTYQMPMMNPSNFASRFPVGDQAKSVRPERKPTDYFRINKQHEKIILERHQADMSRFRGHLTVGRKWPRYSMDIQSSKDVVDPQLLLEILLRPEYFQLEAQGDDVNDLEEPSNGRRFRRKTTRNAGKGRLRGRRN